MTGRRRLAILGRGLIARAVAAALPADMVALLPHAAPIPPDAEAVLWGGRHPALGTPGWRLEDEAELEAARHAAGRGLPFLTLGTRKVYAPSPEPLREDSPLGPADRYGEQKLAIEEALTAILGEDRLTRLRLANVFGWEPGRYTFMARMLDTLARDGEIRFDMSPFTRRDFLPVGTAGAMIGALLRRPPGGVVNVGSGIALECGRLALWLIEGCGRGRLVCESWAERDGFVLDVGRLGALSPVSVTEAELRTAALDLGRRQGATAALDRAPLHPAL